MATIYIVEDDINIREIERYALKNSGYEVEEFEGSASFFKRLEKNIPSLILLDIMLPGEDGLDILTRIRADKATADVPVIMVTALWYNHLLQDQVPLPYQAHLSLPLRLQGSCVSWHLKNLNS